MLIRTFKPSFHVTSPSRPHGNGKLEDSHRSHASKASSGSQVISARSSTSIGRTTASHQIVAKTDIVTNPRKGKTKGKKQHSEPEASDEDDSLEREAALSSPVKGIVARKANKVTSISLQ